MDTGTQMVLEVKKNKLNDNFQWLYKKIQKLDRSLRLRSFCVHIFIFKF